MNIGDQAERSAQEEELRQQQRRMELAQALQGQMAQSQGYAQNSGALAARFNAYLGQVLADYRRILL